MSKIIIYCILFMNLTACAQNTNHSNQKNMNNQDNPEGFIFANYPKEQQFTYILHVNSKTPYELYFDDILVHWDKEAGASESIELNKYILKNGTYKLKLRFLPPVGKTLVAPQDVFYSENLRWKAFFVPIRKNWQAPLGYEDTIDYSDADLKILPPPDSVPFWDQEFEVIIDKIPYQLEGWSNGQDLTKLDQEELKKKVLAYYEKIHDLFNKGKITDYYKLTNKQRQETLTYLYEDFESYINNYNSGINDLINKCQNRMLPIENYEMKIFGNGKLVALMISKSGYKYWTALRSRNEETETTTNWSLTLYMPEGSNELVPIR